MARTACLCLGAVLAALLFATPAFAHSKLVTSQPADGSTVAAPDELVLTFNEGVVAGLSGVDITAADGTMVATPAAVTDGMSDTLVYPLQNLPAGTYHVVWHAVSADTHKIEGEFGFTIAP
jgi:methionine-rich copper-binding protein CopC